MKHNSKEMHDTTAAPTQPLRADFTKRTVRSAFAAKRHEDTKQSLNKILQGQPFMRLFTFLRTVPGIALVAFAVGGSSLSAYAASNWFDGDVSIQQTSDPSIISLDISKCRGVSIPGATAINGKIQYKIMNNAQVTQADVEKHLLPYCELETARNFYAGKFPTLQTETPATPQTYPDNWMTYSNDNTGQDPLTQPFYVLRAATIKEITKSSITLDYRVSIFKFDGAINQHETTTFPFTQNAAVYNQGTESSLDNLHLGDTVLFLAGTMSHKLTPDAFSIYSVFKTQYDLSHASPWIPNVMTVDDYKESQLNQAKYEQAMKDPKNREK